MSMAKVALLLLAPWRDLVIVSVLRYIRGVVRFAGL
jgi:hypothetical protein